MHDQTLESVSIALSPSLTQEDPISNGASRGTTPAKTNGHPSSLSVLLLDEDGHFSQKVAVCLGHIKGVKLHVVSNRRWVPIRFSRYVSSFHSHKPDATDAEQLETVLKTIKKTAADVLFPIVESRSRFVARHKTELARHVALTPIPPVSRLALGLDKRLLFDFLQNHGLPHPPSIILRSVEDAESEAKNLTFPVLFKPAISSGGAGIQLFEERDALFSFLRTAWQPETPALLQSCVHGHDVDCSVLCKDGKILAYTIQVSLLPRRNRFGIDDALEFVSDNETLDVTGRLVSALNWSGVAHVDLRWDSQDNKVKILDFNGRYWTSLLGSLAAGVNFPYLSCLTALGIDFAPPTPHLRKFFTAEAAAGHFGRKFLGRGSPGITIRESGLRYAVNDPGPRVFTLAKRAASALHAKLRSGPD
jgi:predicted ATP-grasp superfamily ATP-dependent carboligase